MRVDDFLVEHEVEGSALVYRVDEVWEDSRDFLADQLDGGLARLLYSRPELGLNVFWDLVVLQNKQGLLVAVVVVGQRVVGYDEATEEESLQRARKA